MCGVTNTRTHSNAKSEFDKLKFFSKISIAICNVYLPTLKRLKFSVNCNNDETN